MLINFKNPFAPGKMLEWKYKFELRVVPIAYYFLILFNIILEVVEFEHDHAIISDHDLHSAWCFKYHIVALNLIQRSAITA